MITYLYWAAVIAVAMAVLFLCGKLDKWKLGITVSLLVWLVAWAAYYFHFQQVFVKRYGGVMTISVPKGLVHLGATWKDDNLWIENFDPATNTCHFHEYSKGSLLEGKVTIKDCNPLLVTRAASPGQPVRKNSDSDEASKTTQSSTP